MLILVKIAFEHENLFVKSLICIRSLMIYWMEIVFKVLGILFNFFKIGGYEIYAYLCIVFFGTRGKIWLLATSTKMLKLQKVF